MHVQAAWHVTATRSACVRWARPRAGWRRAGGPASCVGAAEGRPRVGSRSRPHPVPEGKNMCVQTAPPIAGGKTTLAPDYKLNNICGPL